jgi:hypothetical protein
VQDEFEAAMNASFFYWPWWLTRGVGRLVAPQRIEIQISSASALTSAGGFAGANTCFLNSNSVQNTSTTGKVVVSISLQAS